MTQRILLFSSMFVTVCSSAQEKPNIIYIMTDQQTATAMSCMGNTDINTPNMDRLARSGILFQNAYCSAPLSGPSRASMFTGHTSHEIDMATNGKPMPKELRDKSLGILMKAAGYDCVYGGKWHVHTPSIPDGEFGFRNIHNHNDEGLAEACAAYLDNRPQVPFFMVASFDNPHNICEYARNQNLPFANIQPIDIANCPGLPPNFEQNPYDADIISHEKKLNFSAYPTVSYTPDDWRAYRNAYFRLVEHVDAEIGKIIDAIDRILRVYSHNLREPFGGKQENYAEKKFSFLAPTWYRVTQEAYSSQSGSKPNYFSPKPENGVERYAPDLDATYFNLLIPSLSRPTAEAQLDAYRLVNLEWNYAELSCPGLDFAIYGTEPDGIWQMLAIGKGTRVAVFRYAGREQLSEKLQTLSEAVN